MVNVYRHTNKHSHTHRHTNSHIQTHVHKGTYGDRGIRISTQAHKCMWINRYTHIDMYTMHMHSSYTQTHKYTGIQTHTCRYDIYRHRLMHADTQNSCCLPLQLNRIIFLWWWWGEDKTRQVLHQRRGIQKQMKERKENTQNHYLCKSSYSPSSRIIK